MEFKLRLNRKKKANKVKNREAAGCKRITIRGRKRWVKVKKAGEAEKA
ncbi:MAG: hypothetical protein LBU79_03980 [Planctomycetota bacterium]|jgi:hypothetical protein|nr:hypothetical protein [Planctomycetota bacterium]